LTKGTLSVRIPRRSPCRQGKIPATGKHVRVRACDIATVQNGVITSHRFYFDQMEFLGQLGLVPETPA
jgi:SnoaL-like polyketide cyclase